jgi:hypothetical protein
MTPKSRPRDLGSPDRLFFDDPEKVHHFLGFSPNTLKAWESKGLKIHTWTINKRPIKRRRSSPSSGRGSTSSRRRNTSLK